MRKTDSFGGAPCPPAFCGPEGQSPSLTPIKMLFAAVAAALVLFAIGCGKEAKPIPRQVNGVQLVDRGSLPLYNIR